MRKRFSRRPHDRSELARGRTPCHCRASRDRLLKEGLCRGASLQEDLDVQPPPPPSLRPFYVVESAGTSSCAAA
jgi:hypothetical protein